VKFLLPFLLACVAAAQDAQVSGIVLDGSGAVMPNVAIAIANQNTGVRRASSTNAEGRFVAGGLQPGIYKITARKEGFQTISKIDIKLDVAQSARVDFVLPISAVGESVVVSEQSAVLDRVDATVSTVINRRFIESLPLNGRSFQSLIALTPGVVMTKASFGEQGQFSVNGQRANANYFTIDGVTANIGVSAGLTLVQSSSGSLPGLGATGGTNTLVSVEALEEFRVQTSGYPAEYGRMPGAQITILTRSGTNALHGSLFNFFRNDVLDANDWFANAERLPKPALRQNDFGGVLGGPIRQNRTFFFASYEGLRLRQPQVRSTDVPTLDARERAGDSTQKYLQSFPLPNRPAGRLGFAPFVASYTDSSSLDAGSIRIDHLIGSKISAFARFNYAPSNSVSRLLSINNPTSTIANTRTLTAGAAWVISPRLTNEFRVNQSYTTGESFSRLDNFGGARPLSPEEFFPSTVDAANSFGGYFLTGAINGGWYLGKNVANAQNQWNLVDHFSFVRGNHQWKFGVDWRTLSTLNSPRAYDQFFYFVGTAGAIFGQTSQTVLGAQETIAVRFQNWSSFAQDTWRIHPRLTLSYGVRWEINPAPVGSKPLYTFLEPADKRDVRPAPVGTPLYRTDWTGFAPRLGLVWQLSPQTGRQTTLRTGWGLFHDLGAGIIGQSAAGYPYFRQRNFLQGTFFPLPEELAKAPEFTLNPPINAIYGASQGLRLPVTHQWNVTLERALGSSRIFSVGYVGAAGRRLLRQEYWVNPNEDVTYAYLLRNRAFSDFHSLQAQVQQRPVKGIQFLASYTFGKSLDTNSNDSVSNLIALQIDPKRDRGPSDFDIRHTLSGAWTLELPYWFRGWSIDGVVSLRTATPVDVTFYRDLGFGIYNLRPDPIEGVPMVIEDPNVAGGRRYNYDAFEIPWEFPGRQGKLGRNVLRGFGLAQVNLTVRREFTIREPLKLQFRAEMFNALNHPSFADPSGSLLSPQFGYSTSMLGRSLGRGGVNGGLNPLFQIGGPRSVQLSARFVF
jgi:hypothetical protein